MWGKLKESRPWLYEAIKCGCVLISAAAFVLVLAVYLR